MARASDVGFGSDPGRPLDVESGANSPRTRRRQLYDMLNEKLPSSGSPRKGNWKLNRRKLLVCTIISVILGTIITIPVIYFAIVPAVIKIMAEKSKMELLGMSLSDPTDTDFAIELHAKLGNGKAPVPIRVEPFVADISDDDGGQILQFQMPELRSLTIDLAQRVNVTNPEGMIKFAKTILTADEVAINVRGSTHVHVIGHKYKFDLSKRITQKGLKDLTGIVKSIQSVPGGKVQAEVNLYNPSLISADFGPCQVSIHLATASLGEPVASLGIKPGKNSLSLQTDLDINKLLQDPNIFSTIGPLLTQEQLPIEVKGVKALKSAWVTQVMPSFDKTFMVDRSKVFSLAGGMITGGLGSLGGSSPTGNGTVGGSSGAGLGGVISGLTGVLGGSSTNGTTSSSTSPLSSVISSITSMLTNPMLGLPGTAPSSSGSSNFTHAAGSSNDLPSLPSVIQNLGGTLDTSITPENMMTQLLTGQSSNGSQKKQELESTSRSLVL